MKKLVIAVISLCLMISCLVIQERTVFAQQIVLRAVSMNPKSYQQHNHALHRFIDRIAVRAPGRIEIKFIGGPDVINPFKLFSAVSDGSFDLGLAGTVYSVGEVPEYNILDYTAPWTWPDSFRNTKALDLLRQVTAEKKGIHLLGLVSDGPMYILTNKKPVQSVADMKGLKFRTPGNIGDRLARKLGAVAVSMPITEFYDAMQKGVVDGGFINAISFWSYKAHEFAKFFTVPLIDFKVGLYVNNKKWESIPADLRGIMEEEMKRVEVEHFGFFQGIDYYYTKWGEEHGMKYFDMPKSELDAFRKARTDALEDFYVKETPKYGTPIYEELKRYL